VLVIRVAHGHDAVLALFEEFPVERSVVDVRDDLLDLLLLLLSHQNLILLFLTVVQGGVVYWLHVPVLLLGGVDKGAGVQEGLGCWALDVDETLLLLAIWALHVYH
jgi:hypothetical protein